MEKRWRKQWYHDFKKIVFPLTLIITIMMLIQVIPKNQALGKSTDKPNKKWKVLHIMSYHLPWEWTDDQFNGFKNALKGLDIEYKIFQMDTKRKSTEQWKEKIGKQARDLIDIWKPDLVYTSDDDAQEYVTKYYINTDIPFVFSGVNSDPEKYGFVNSKNVTGILEQELFVQSVQLLKKIVPDVKKIAVIIDDGPTWNGVVQRMKTNLGQLPDIQVIGWYLIKTFKKYKHKMKELQTQADAIALLGIFTYKDEKGKNVPYTEVLKWTVENSKLPDFSFWKDRISYGTLCTVTVSGYEQGLAAGKIARGILVEGKSPSIYPMNATVKGEPVVSLERAKRLGIKIKSGILLHVDVIDKFQWEK